MNTVVELRRAGHKVRVIHMRWNPDYTGSAGMILMSRFEAEDNGLEWEPDSKGGLTIVEITSPDGSTKRGESLCSVQDGYCRKFGLQRALQRALGAVPALAVHGETKRLMDEVNVSLDIQE